MSTASAHMHWPAERFYWAVLEVPGVRRAGPLPEGLWPDLLDEVPASAGPLHAVAAPAPGGQLVVCAAPEEALETLDEGTLRLTPEALPACVDAPVDPRLLNLLAGAYEPAAARRVRTRRHVIAAGTVLLCSLLLTAGLVRRSERWQLAARSADNNLARILEEASEIGTAESLRAELARAQASAGAAVMLKPPRDVTADLAALLLAWPTQIAAAPQSLTLRGDVASLSVVVNGEGSTFLGAFKPPAGWTLLEPRLNTAGPGQVRLQLELRRAPEGTP